MCDPMTLIMGLASVAAPLLSSPPKPPKAEIPASPAPNARAPGATVRVGTGAKDDRTPQGPVERSTFKEQRKSGKSIGGLGRSGLGL